MLTTTMLKPPLLSPREQSGGVVGLKRMFWALAAAISLHLAMGVGESTSTKGSNTAPNSSLQQNLATDTPSCDVGGEVVLLNMTNSARAHAGLQPLKVDEGLQRAARVHAAQMATQSRISHQFSDEPSLRDRIAANSHLHLDREGENVAEAPTVDEAHQALMASPPHRANLLNSHYNIAGFAVFRKGNRIYVAQDFGSSIQADPVEREQQLLHHTDLAH